MKPPNQLADFAFAKSKIRFFSFVFYFIRKANYKDYLLINSAKSSKFPALTSTIFYDDL